MLEKARGLRVKLSHKPGDLPELSEALISWAGEKDSRKAGAHIRVRAVLCLCVPFRTELGFFFSLPGKINFLTEASQ